MFRYASLAFKNTFRNRRRSLLTIISIAVSLCLFGVLIAMYHALFMAQPTPGQALRLVTRHKVSITLALPLSDENKIRQIPGVKEISVWNWYQGTYKDSRDFKNFFARLGVEPEAFLRIRTDMKMSEEERKAFVKTRTGCVISRDLSQKLNLKLNDRVVLTGDIYPSKLDMKVVGIFEDPDATQSLFFNWDYVKEQLPVPRRSLLSTMAILVDSPENVEHVERTIDSMFAESPYPTKTETESQFAMFFVNFIGNIKLFLMLICAAVTFTILLVSGNTMAMSVRERIKEVGVLKTLGFDNQAILGMIVGESAFISLIGGAIGIILAALLSFVGAQVMGGFLPQLHNLSMGWFAIFASLILALVVGVASSFVPAYNAAKTDILDSLRYSG